MKTEVNTAKEVLKIKKSKEKSEETKKKESMNRLIQSYYQLEDAKEKERMLSIIRRTNPGFKPIK